MQDDKEMYLLWRVSVMEACWGQDDQTQKATKTK